MIDRPATECKTDEKEIEITPEMIEAGMAVLWNDIFCDHLGPTDCKLLAREIIERALEARHRETRVDQDQDA